MEKVPRSGCGSRKFSVYVDTSHCAIQSPEVAAVFQQLMVASNLKARRVAIMQGSSRTRMQTRRIAACKDRIAHFAAQAEADSWLAAKEDA